MPRQKKMSSIDPAARKFASLLLEYLGETAIGPVNKEMMLGGRTNAKIILKRVSAALSADQSEACNP